MKKILFQWLVLFSVFFTVITLFSSTLMLALGQSEDSHAHILMRGGFVFIASSTMILFKNYKPKTLILKYLTPYVVMQSMVFLIVFIAGMFIDLHPNAYRDAFLNFSSVALIVIIILIVIDFKKQKRLTQH